MKSFKEYLLEATNTSEVLFRDKFITVTMSPHAHERYKERNVDGFVSLDEFKALIKKAATSIKNMKPNDENLYFSKSTRYGFVIGNRGSSKFSTIITFLPRMEDDTLPFAKRGTKFVLLESQSNITVDNIVYID